eukprot:Gb_23416 [translate_table: standard]
MGNEEENKSTKRLRSGRHEDEVVDRCDESRGEFHGKRLCNNSSDRKTEFLDLIFKEEEGEEIRLPEQEEVINRVMRSLEEEIFRPPKSTLTANCCVQSDSAFCMTSSSSRLSDPVGSYVGKCRCHAESSCIDELGYLLEASDEELGIPTSPGCSDDNFCGELLNDLQGLAASSESSYIMNGLVDIEGWDMGTQWYEDFHLICEENYSKEAFLLKDCQQEGLPCTSREGTLRHVVLVNIGNNKGSSPQDDKSSTPIDDSKKIGVIYKCR